MKRPGSLKAVVLQSFVLSTALLSAQTNSPPSIALKAARLFDGSGAAPVSPAVVVIRGERIERVGTPSEVEIPGSATVIDLGRDTILPELIDTHGHIQLRYTGGGAVGQAEQAAQGPGSQAMRMVKNARTQLLCGITTMRMVGDETGLAHIQLDLERAIESGMIPGPRIIPAGIIITSSGGHTTTPGSQVDGPWEVIHLVRDNFRRGARLIKLSMVDLSSERAQLRPEEVRAAVEEAHGSGIPVTAHCTGKWGSAIRTALEAGVDSIEHARPLTEKIIQLLKKHATAISLTPLVYIGFRPSLEWWRFLDQEVVKPEQWIRFMREEMLKWRREHPQWETEDRPYEDNEANRAARDFFPGVKKRQAAVFSAYRAGVPIGLGLDTYYGGLTLTMEWMVEAGIPLRDVIHMATGSAAKISGVAEEVGTLAPGKLADIISVAGDPAQDITNLHKIHLVMKGGKRYDTLSWN